MSQLARRARDWLARPLREQAPSLLAAVLALLVLAGVASAAGALRGGEAPRRLPAPAPPVLGRALPPQHGGEQILDDAQDTARAFLEEYLPFAYGQGPLPDTGLSPQLREQLRSDYASGRARAPVRAEVELRPELVRLDLSGRRPERELQGRARIHDGGGTPYDVELTLRRRGGRWQVTELGRP